MHKDVWLIYRCGGNGMAPPMVISEIVSEEISLVLRVGAAHMTILEYSKPVNFTRYYQPIYFEKGRKVLIEIHLEPDVAVLVNGAPLKDAENSLLPFRLSAAEEQLDDREYQSKFSAIEEEFFPLKERRFIQLIKAIEQDAMDGSETCVVRACSTLRPVLLEGHLDLVNKPFKIKILFKIPKKTEIYELANVFLSNFYDLPDGSLVDGVNRENFLRQNAVKLNGEFITVKDLILLAANSLGQHHFGASKRSAAEEFAFRNYDMNHVNDMPALLKPMRGICFCFLDAVAPLVDAIVTSAKPV